MFRSSYNLVKLQSLVWPSCLKDRSLFDKISFRSYFMFSIKLFFDQFLLFDQPILLLYYFSIKLFFYYIIFRSNYFSIILFFDQITFLLYSFSIKWPFLVGGVSRQAKHLIDGLLDTCFELERTQKLSIQKLCRLNVIIY